MSIPITLETLTSVDL